MLQLKQTQIEDVTQLLKHDLRAIIANAPGTGKTATTIAAIALAQEKRTPALIIAPASVTRNWLKEFQMWAPSLTVHLLESELKEFPKLRTGEVAVISWALLQPRLGSILQTNWACIAADEAHFAKNPGAARTAALRTLCTPERGVLLLTGTPIVNSLNELKQLESLFDGEEPLLLRRLLRDVAPEIPAKKRAYLIVNLEKKVANEYQKAQNEFEDWLVNQRRTLEEQGMELSAIEKIMSVEGFVKIGYLRRILAGGKVKAAADFAARTVRMGEPLVIFCEHQVVIRNLSKALHRQRLRHRIIDGTATTKERQEAIEMFQRNEIPVIICSKAGKEGITLHAARHMLFVEQFYTSAEVDQAEDRIRRIGQKFATTIWYAHVNDTVDDRVDSIVNNKRRLVEETIGNEIIAENEAENVREIILTWDNRSDPERQRDPKTPIVDLGNAPPLAPLPSPRQTHALLFDMKRWTQKGVLRWCRMNGYERDKLIVMDGQIKVRVHPADVFVKGSFEKVVLADHIAVIQGKRVPKAKEKVIRATLKAASDMTRLRLAPS